MNYPELYAAVNELERRDAQDVLDEVKDLLPWTDQETILDLGCGPGDLTTSLLYSSLPMDSKIVGGDISEAMVNYAQAKYGNDQFSFKQLDIGNPNIWINWEEETFEKIFSFYCMHWVKDQSQAAENMYSLLKGGGYIVTMFTISHPFLTLFNTISKNPKWKFYAKVWKPWEVFSHRGVDPKEEYIKIIKDNGFEIVKCVTKERSFVHSSLKSFIDYFESINPFKKRIPKEKTPEFLEDCKQLLLERGLLELTKDMEAVHKYTLIITVARKP